MDNMRDKLIEIIALDFNLKPINTPIAKQATAISFHKDENTIPDKLGSSGTVN